MTTEEALIIKQNTIENFKIVEEELFLHHFKVAFDVWLKETPDLSFEIEEFGHFLEHDIERLVAIVFPDIKFNFFRHSDGVWEITVG